jgi:hypothetical protein
MKRAALDSAVRSPANFAETLLYALQNPDGDHVNGQRYPE